MNEVDPDGVGRKELVAGDIPGGSCGAFRPVAVPARPAALTVGARPVVVVLGMHRSGTSLLSNVLHYLGVDMADETDVVGDKNPAGFWERPELVALHDEVLEAIGRPIASPLNCLPFPPGWWRDKAVLPFRARLREYVERHRDPALGWWGFKDPRTCRLLPLWLETFSQMGIKAHYVWAIRSPVEAAASMAAKSPVLRPMSVAQAEVMWLAYNYDILRHYQVINPIVICYREWFDDPMRGAHRLVSGLGLPNFYSESEFGDCIHNIVRRSYRRYRDNELPTPSVPLAQRIYLDVASRRLDPAVQTWRDLVEGHVSNLETMFRSIDPFVQLLDELPKLRNRLRGAEQQASARMESDAQREAAIAEVEAKLRESELRRRDLEVACAGYLARIEALTRRQAGSGQV